MNAPNEPTRDPGMGVAIGWPTLTHPPTPNERCTWIERRFVMRLRLLPAVLAGALSLVGCPVQVAAAADVASACTGHFTQHFGGRNSEGVICADDAINCGTGQRRRPRHVRRTPSTSATKRDFRYSSSRSRTEVA